MAEPVDDEICEGDGIGSAPIDPDAEGVVTPVSSTLAKKEYAYFDKGKELDHKLDIHKHDLGWLGKLLGSRGQAPVNIAGVLVVVLVIFIIASSFFETSSPLEDSRKWATGLVTLIVGYLFGSVTKDKDK